VIDENGIRVRIGEFEQLERDARAAGNNMLTAWYGERLACLRQALAALTLPAGPPAQADSPPPVRVTVHSQSGTEVFEAPSGGVVITEETDAVTILIRRTKPLERPETTEPEIMGITTDRSVAPEKVARTIFGKGY
jgi:hypothetical protein